MMEIPDGIALWGATRSREKLIVTVAGRGGQLEGKEVEKQKPKRECGWARRDNSWLKELLAEIC
jgi:hypothetical protein